ncbi:MAG TPA: DNA-processing protein DprA [Candidatus Hydrogenedentes bacterium]|nr:DNA-processing protein DprA [Candidatus Hydrogenedentota bacterium]HOH51674.1 DNA-processing protein DprA [Candidatus Hydrogenedentota bacterium]HQL95569.1 DNA-processing protein DprA [Candidatus Hydrogenedentota bacterium]
MSPRREENAGTPSAPLVLLLLQRPGLGIRSANRLLDVFGGDPARWRPLAGWPIARVLAAHPVLTPHQAEWVAQMPWAEWSACEEGLRKAEADGVRAVCRGQEGYPAAFDACLGADAPPLLYHTGDLALASAVAGAVVGTRSPSRNGLRAAGRCAASLVRGGAVVVSGAAAGVDTAAHETALRDGGRSVAVFPQGLLTLTLPDPWREAVEAGRLLLLSECPPHAGWQTHAAVARNRLIAALARAVCVVEPRKMGGSIQTARHAAAQGRAVFGAGHTRLPQAVRSLFRPLPEDDAALDAALGAELAKPVVPSAAGAGDKLF